MSERLRPKDLKERLEHTVASTFLESYNWGSRHNLSIIRPGKPPEPDLVGEDSRSHERIGIEVSCAYYDYGGRHAKSVWEPARGKTVTSYHVTRPDFQENISVLAHAARIIRGKARNVYATHLDHCLLIVLTFPWRLYLCDADVEERLAELRIPKKHPFTEIHMFSQHGEVYQLFPRREWFVR